MKKEKKRNSFIPALAWRMSAALMALWLVCMCLVTVMKARSLQDQWEHHVESIYSNFDFADDHDGASSELDHQRIDMMESFNWYAEEREYETAMVFLENDKQVMDSHSFGYMYAIDAADWYAGNTSDEFYWFLPVIRMDLDYYLGEGHPVLTQLQEDGFLDANMVRVTGYYSMYNEFVPVSIATFNLDNYSVHYAGKSLGQWDAEGKLDWTVLYETEEDTQGIPLVELFSENLSYFSRGALGNPSGSSNEQLIETLKNIGGHWYLFDQNSSLTDTVIIRTHSLTSVNGSVHEVRAGVCGNPLKVAMKKLMPVYILTLALPLGLIVLYRRRLELQLEYPLRQVIFSAGQNMSPIAFPHDSKWKEPYQLQQGYISAQKELQTLRQENQQLKTALDYAQNAEINRRQMVSNITHELKTPLAVIHSYAEGLQAGIAPEKQGRYLDVITEEADRMDAMVLEMLDLSRLEAGKVRLAQDRVELLSLTQGILEKLAPLLEVKGLSADFAVADVCHLTADEGRLSQVITNLVSNAIKYSPEGGKITLTVFQRNGISHFLIENQSAPLSQDALERVWESFYRTEQSRTSKGTGLGLSICKAIIELHRGTCHVKNTSTGVEFGFILPS